MDAPPGRGLNQWGEYIENPWTLRSVAVIVELLKGL